MSKGHGSIQRQILDILKEPSEWIDGYHYSSDLLKILKVQPSSMRRALRKLEEEDRIERTEYNSYSRYYSGFGWKLKF